MNKVIKKFINLNFNLFIYNKTVKNKQFSLKIKTKTLLKMKFIK